MSSVPTSGPESELLFIIMNRKVGESLYIIFKGPQQTSFGLTLAICNFKAAFFFFFNAFNVKCLLHGENSKMKL